MFAPLIVVDDAMGAYVSKPAPTVPTSPCCGPPKLCGTGLIARDGAHTPLKGSHPPLSLVYTVTATLLNLCLSTAVVSHARTTLFMNCVQHIFAALTWIRDGIPVDA